MNILFVGKLPPIQGGVSTSCMWSLIDICEAGHSVFYLTNTKVANSNYKAYEVQGETPLFAHPKLKVIEIEEVPFNSYRPWANPFFNLFLGCAHKVLAENKIDCIIGWYLEPYGSVAATLGKLYSIPCVLRHAGSDLGMLMNFPSLRSSYTWAAKNATFVLANGTSADFFEDIGVSKSRIVPVFARRLSNIYRYNHRIGKSIPSNIKKIEDFIELFHDWLGPQNIITSQILNSLNQGKVDRSTFRMLMYGKLGLAKGSYQILKSLEYLANAGYKFEFYYALSGHKKQIELFCNDLSQRTVLQGKVFLLPPVMPWHVPDILNQVDLALFLEHDFPIEIHAPRVPREILASKAHLLCTREIVNKLPFRANLVEYRNISIVEDPSNIHDLSQAIEKLLVDPSKVSAMSAHARYLSDFIENEYSAKDVLVNVLSRIS